MNHKKSAIVYQAPGVPFAVSISSNATRLEASLGEAAVMSFDFKDAVMTLIQDHDGPERERIHLHAIEFVLSHNPDLKEIDCTGLQAPCADALSHHLFRQREGRLLLDREVFFQYPAVWHRRQQENFQPERWIRTNERAHPERPRVEAGLLYRRYVPSLGRTLSFELFDRKQHLDVLHAWHHQPRVAIFWEMAMAKDKLDEHMAKMEEDPHQRPVMAFLDGQAIGYFEAYWTPEDRLGPYYEYDPFDRGFHFLIGESSVLGGQMAAEFIQSLVHFIFLDDPRTRRVMGEPRYDNAKVLRYLDTLPGWKKIKEFDFPHKRAALVQIRREDFFLGGSL